MRLEHTVSRKTPRDGKLEITKPAAEQLQRFGDAYAVELGGKRAPATIDSFECTCRGPEHRHVHYFLQSELLKTLRPDARVHVDVDGPERRVVIHEPDPSVD